MATGLWGNPYGTFLLKLNSSFWSFSCSEAGVWPRFHRYLSMVRMATWRVFMTCQCRALVSVAAVSPQSADVCSGHHTTVLRCRCLYTRMLQDYHFVSFFNKLLICRVLGITEWAGSFNFAIVLKSTQRAAMEGRPDRPIKQWTLSLLLTVPCPFCHLQYLILYIY